MLHHSSAAPQALMQPQTFNIQDLELSNDLPPPGEGGAHGPPQTI